VLFRSVADEVVADALRNLAAKQTVKFLGSYPMAGSEAGEARRKAHGKAWRAASAWVEDLRTRVQPA
jgi:hypothetical protein